MDHFNPEFARDPRGVRLGLSTKDFQPHSEASSPYSFCSFSFAFACRSFSFTFACRELYCLELSNLFFFHVS
jgi:hypothetical protein